MSFIRRSLLTVAVVQILSTLLGVVTLLAWPDWYEPALEGTAFEGQTLIPALLLGLVVGGTQWIAAVVQLRARRWLPLSHTVAGSVMIGWIGCECLIMDSFVWPHALWGGLGAIQLLLVLLLLGVTHPWEPTSPDCAWVAGSPDPAAGR